MSSTLVDLLRARAQAAPDDLVCGFLPDGEGELVTLTAGELEREARRIASVVSSQVAPGGRTVLVFEPGLDFVCAFFGCLFAEVAAVPVYPPNPRSLASGVEHVARVVGDSGAEAVLASGLVAAVASDLPEAREVLAAVPWIVTDRREAGDADAWRAGALRSDSLAMLQYTSGSTAAPRGVALTHENLVANLEAIHWFLGEPEACVMVSWLPMYHDMGLIGTVLYPVCGDARTYLMSPLHFLQRPARWLELVTRVCGTVSGGPNFAYELCLRRLGDEDLDGIDLASWDLAFNGAEPVRAATVRRFEERFARCGLRAGTVGPCYGMAEASLLITGFRRGEGARELLVDRDELRADRLVPAEADEPTTVELASSGRVPPGHDVRIVDPDRRVELPEGRVGEIWLRSRSVSNGYWHRPDETASAFGAVLATGARYLRTGDLGAMRGGDLFVTGRIKDLLVIRGRNIHPHDVEDAAAAADRRARPGGGVAFAIEGAEGEEIALIQETTAEDAEELEEVAARISTGVLERLDVALGALYLVPPRSVGKTSSGKVQRRRSRAALAAGELSVLLATGPAAKTPVPA